MSILISKKSNLFSLREMFLENSNINIEDELKFFLKIIALYV